MRDELRLSGVQLWQKQMAYLEATKVTDMTDSPAVASIRRQMDKVAAGTAQ